MKTRVDEVIGNLTLDDIESEYRWMLSKYKEEYEALDYDKILWNQ